VVLEWLNGKWKCVTWEIYSNSLEAIEHFCTWLSGLSTDRLHGSIYNENFTPLT